MTVPQTPADAPNRPGAPGHAEWIALTAADKRERILDAAIAVFSELGLDAPMQLVADRAGAGVASIYRAFESKHDLLAAIVVRRMDELTAAFAAAEEAPGDRWSALVSLISDRVAHQSREPFTLEARALVEDRPEVDAAVGRAGAAQRRLLDAARDEGRLRADATVEDLRLLFAATRTARRMDPACVPRMLELMLDALDAHRTDDR